MENKRRKVYMLVNLSKESMSSPICSFSYREMYNTMRAECLDTQAEIESMAALCDVSINDRTAAVTSDRDYCRWVITDRDLMVADGSKVYVLTARCGSRLYGAKASINKAVLYKEMRDVFNTAKTTIVTPESSCLTSNSAWIKGTGICNEWKIHTYTANLKNHLLIGEYEDRNKKFA